MTTRGMKKALLLTAAATATLLAACQNTTHRVDRFDNVRIQQMEANNVSRDWFEKVVVCLNARREVRADGTADHFLLLEHTPIPEFTLAPADVRRRIRSPRPGQPMRSCSTPSPEAHRTGGRRWMRTRWARGGRSRSTTRPR